MNQITKRFEPLIIAGLLIWGVVFLLRLPYLQVWVIMPVCVAYLWAIHSFVRAHYKVKIPVALLFLVWATVALDSLGNLRFGGSFSMYDTKFKYIQYDEFAHTVIPALVAPVIVWLLRAGLDRFGIRLPLGLVTFFAMTTVFTISGFYEIVELWDDKYMWPTPGMRIHGAYDTANDLQCDLIGMTIGGLMAYAILKRQRETVQVTA
ncbi:MAG TPA: hypothetical protein VFV58_33415 [Blastocatellia bacterium]|jgi:uncharacterized membrane protein YjdF|nr:hypothetical protein [Blastocatellia bacterium]